MFCTNTHCTDSTSKYIGPFHGNMSGKQVTCVDNADGKYEQILICSTHDIVLLCYTIDILRHQSLVKAIHIEKLSCSCTVGILKSGSVCAQFAFLSPHSQ